MRSLEECRAKFSNVESFGSPALPSRAACDVLNERLRQVQREGWTPEHDDAHGDNSLALAAVCYALPPKYRELEERPFERIADQAQGESVILREYLRVPWPWPVRWHGFWWKPKSRRQDLIRAAALLIAEIERLDRAVARMQKKGARPATSDASPASGPNG